MKIESGEKIQFNSQGRPGRFRGNQTVYRATVLDSRDETPSTRSIRVVKPKDFSFKASQFARLYVDTGEGEDRRPMSIASSPTREYLEFAVRRSESSFKKAFFSLNKGDEVRLAGPFGHFFLDPDHPAILIAGGIGITPFKSMIDFAADSGLLTSLTLVYSNRSPDEVVFREELDALARSGVDLDLIYTMTRSTDEDGWNGRRGRIDLELLREVSEGKNDAVYYVCGTPGMVNDSIDMLHKIGVEPDRILKESFRGYARRLSRT